MRGNVRKLLFGLAIGAALSSPAKAEEQLVMPFACHVAGGRVLLAPSAPQTYQIYGRREQKRMTTCSPFDPRACQNWSIYRFDIDCGGVRTSWQSVVAALSPILAESLGPADSAYNEPPPRGPARPVRPISFPPGFAPNPMRVASFKQTRAAPAPQPADVPLPPKKPDSEAPAQVAETAPNHAPAVGPSATGGKTEAANSKTPAAPKATAVAEHRPLKVEVVSGSGETEVVSGSDEMTGSLPNESESGSLWRDAATVFAVTLGALLALSAILLMRQRGVPALPMPVSFARLRGPATRRPLARTSRSAREDTEADAEPDDAPANRLRLWDETWLPGTMSEALDVLGVEPAASRDRIKSTVQRLRRALHPDYALDEEDRVLRERRLKQINVAWEIVSGKRHALFLAAKPRAS